MRRFTLIATVLLAIFLYVSPAAAWFFDDTLVVIDDSRYTSKDFKRWWGFWKEEGQELPKTAEFYVDWLLLAREGDRMELASDPSFQRQDRVFLQSRVLLMLKFDAIDSRIKVTDDDIRAHYAKHYVPQWLVQRLDFANEEAALAAWLQLTSGAVTMEELLARTVEAGGPLTTQKNWLRPKGIDPGWSALFQNMAVGDVVDPAEHQGGNMLYHLAEMKTGDDADYAKLRAEMEREVWKEQEGALTQELLADLRRKYEVVVDEERFAKLDVNAPPDSFTDDLIITTNRQNVTEKDFMIIARREMDARPDAAHASFDEKEAKALKYRVLSGILAQNLTNWESMDRHYEEKEPFKWEYDFHLRHKLTTALENRLFASEVTVSEEEIKKHYTDNLPRYTQPALAKLYIIDDTQGPVELIWADVATGKDFAKALKEHVGQEIFGQEVPVNHIDPEIKTVLDRLAPGETSQPFTAKGSQVIVHLIKRVPESPIPMDRLATAIRNRIQREKMNTLRKDYLDVLKSRSKIEIRESEWKAVRKELGGTK